MTTTATGPPSPPTMKAAPATAPKAAKAPAFTMPTAKAIVPRTIFNCVEGWGKTSLAAFIPNVHLVLAENETGYQTLFNKKLVPAVPTVIVQSWNELLAVVDGMIATPPSCSMVAFDALGGFEYLCHKHVCERDYDGEWGEKGFLSYHKGYDRSVTDWRGLLQRFDAVVNHGIGVILLSHAQKRPFKNPLGEDYDRYEADCHPKTWAVTHRWADAVFFGTFETVVETDKKGKSTRKGIGKNQRLLLTERRDAYDAKNRYGLSELFHMPTVPGEMWKTIWTAIEGDVNAAG